MKLGIRLKQSNFEYLTQNFAPLVLPTPSPHSLERIPDFYSVGIECLKNLNIIKKMTDTLRISHFLTFLFPFPSEFFHIPFRLFHPDLKAH